MKPTLTLLYDASCPVCSLEMDHLRERNQAGTLGFIDISVAGFDPASYGTTLEALNAEIHAVQADGTLIHGLRVLRLAYAEVGLGWVLRPTGFGPLRALSDVGYRLFARHRQRISRLAAPLILAVRARRMRQCQSHNGACQR